MVDHTASPDPPSPHSPSGASPSPSRSFLRGWLGLFAGLDRWKVLVVAGIGALCTVFPLWSLWLGIQTWTRSERTEGRISQSRVEDEGRSPTEWSAIEYRYSVGDQVYSSSRVKLGAFPRLSFLPLGSDRIEGRQYASKYPEGREVTVHYDPRRPERAVLERQLLPFWTLFMLAFGVGMLAPAATALLPGEVVSRRGERA